MGWRSDPARPGPPSVFRRETKTSAPAPPTHIARFEILATLGTGAEGSVYRALDPRLDRQVAVKTLRLDPGGGLRRDGIASLLDEARIVATLSHPNIVPLHDAGEHAGTPYLVFEYVEGKTLAAVLRAGGPLPVAQAVEIAIALAQGIAYAHERGIIHRDIKPANIMIAPDGVPRLMDFGIARRIQAGGAASRDLTGTPSYVAPESITQRAFVPAGDQFALGVVLYEMVTGMPPIEGGSPREIVRRIVEEDFVLPSQRSDGVDARLDGLLMKALAKNPDERFASAAEMAKALHEYLHPDVDAQTDAGTGTLDYLLRRIRHKGDFPAMSATITAVNRAVASDREPISVLCDMILKDFALTTRLLKLVNASQFTQFGGEISTVSRAIAIVGFNTVRNLAMSLTLFEHLHEHANAAALKDLAIGAYFSGLLARELARNTDTQNAEQAFVCAMFHRLGKLLATFYLHEEALAVTRAMQTHGWDEDRASLQVLGLRYEDLGIGVAKAWNLPDDLRTGMRAVASPGTVRPAREPERLRLLAGLTNELSEIIRAGEEPARPQQVRALLARYGPATGIHERVLNAAVQDATAALMRDAETLGHGVARSGFARKARDWNPAAPPKPQAAPGGGPDTVRQIVLTQHLSADAALDSGAAADPDAPAAPGKRQALLAAGIQDITNSLVGEQPLQDVLRIILETMYRAIGFDRVLLFILDAPRQALRCRYGFGPGADTFVRQKLALPLHGDRDLFYAATVMGVDLCVTDLDAEKVRAHVPDWYRRELGARGLVLLPIAQKKRTVGLIYGDSASAATLHFSAEELGLLKTLRNQAVLAMRQAG